jgi:hypothetical protein
MAAATLYARPPVQQGRLSTGTRVPPPDGNSNCDPVTRPACGDLQAPDNSKEFEKFHINAIANYSQVDILQAVSFAILAWTPP